MKKIVITIATIIVLSITAIVFAVLSKPKEAEFTLESIIKLNSETNESTNTDRIKVPLTVKAKELVQAANENYGLYHSIWMLTLVDGESTMISAPVGPINEDEFTLTMKDLVETAQKENKKIKDIVKISVIVYAYSVNDPNPWDPPVIPGIDFEGSVVVNTIELSIIRMLGVLDPSGFTVTESWGTLANRFQDYSHIRHIDYIFKTNLEMLTGVAEVGNSVGRRTDELLAFMTELIGESEVDLKSIDYLVKPSNDAFMNAMKDIPDHKSFLENNESMLLDSRLLKHWQPFADLTWTKSIIDDLPNELWTIGVVIDGYVLMSVVEFDLSGELLYYNFIMFKI